MSQSDLLALIDRLVAFVESLPVDEGSWHVEQARFLSAADRDRFLDLDLDLYAEAGKHGLRCPDDGTWQESIGWTRLNEIGSRTGQVDGVQRPTTYVVEIETWRRRLDLLRRRAEQVRESGDEQNPPPEGPPVEILVKLDRDCKSSSSTFWTHTKASYAELNKHVWDDLPATDNAIYETANRLPPASPAAG